MCLVDPNLCYTISGLPQGRKPAQRKLKTKKYIMHISADISKKHKVNGSKKELMESLMKNMEELNSCIGFTFHLHHHCWGPPPQWGKQEPTQ